MTEKTLFKFEREMSKKNIADHLEKITEKLRAGEPIKFDSDSAIELNPSSRSDFEIKVEEDGDEVSLELEIEWNKSSSGNSELNIS